MMASDVQRGDIVIYVLPPGEDEAAVAGHTEVGIVIRVIDRAAGRVRLKVLPGQAHEHGTYNVDADRDATGAKTPGTWHERDVR